MSPDSVGVCPNISPREQHRRLIAGAVQFAVAAGVLGVLLATGAGRWWRLALAPLYFGGAAGVFQAREKT